MTYSIDRRDFLKIGAATLAAQRLGRPAHAEQPLWPTQTVGPFVEVEIGSGRIRGGHSRGALAFKGIPYAGSVSGKNRFKAAPAVVPWTGVRDATLLGPPAMQAPGGTYGEREPAYSEDCLALNVWTPAVKDGGKRPVMFSCHGGGFTSGSGGHIVSDGAHLAATYDVVVVTTNHRLGLFGYLSLGELGGEEYATSGNQGLLDIVAALRWVKQNIGAFGGDPDNVMLFGGSGGGYKTSALMAMPVAHGLFHKAGMMSGAMLRGTPKTEATETARKLLTSLDIAPTSLSKLADVPAEKLLSIQLGWGPVVDGTYLPHHPFDPAAPNLSVGIPLIIGNTHDELLMFVFDQPAFFHMDEATFLQQLHQNAGDQADRILATYRKTMPNATPVDLAVAIGTAVQFGNDTVTLADRKSLQRAPVYRYRYDYQSNQPIKGTDWTVRACHGSDGVMLSMNLEFWGFQGNGPGLPEVSKAMSSYFASFARHGVPSALGQPAWPRYNIADRAAMLINSKCNVAHDPNSEERKMWQSFG